MKLYKENTPNYLKEELIKLKQTMYSVNLLLNKKYCMVMDTSSDLRATWLIEMYNIVVLYPRNVNRAGFGDFSVNSVELDLESQF